MQADSNVSNKFHQSKYKKMLVENEKLKKEISKLKTINKKLRKENEILSATKSIGKTSVSKGSPHIQKKLFTQPEKSRNLINKNQNDFFGPTSCYITITPTNKFLLDGMVRFSVDLDYNLPEIKINHLKNINLHKENDEMFVKDLLKTIYTEDELKTTSSNLLLDRKKLFFIKNMFNDRIFNAGCGEKDQISRYRKLNVHIDNLLKIMRN